MTEPKVGSIATGMRPVRRALVSVYDKTGLEDLAAGLHAAGVALVSTGSTAARIAAAGIPVTAVEQVTGFPECLDGRVKTLHPAVHAGILADLRLPAHAEALAALRIEPFDLVVVNLYPFAATVASGADYEECVEQIDIGGPAMVRAAAKNHAGVAVVVDPARYPEVLDAVRSGGLSFSARQRLAAAAFAHTATYDAAVAEWMAMQLVAEEPAPGAACWPSFIGRGYSLVAPLRYGENPHQAGALYAAAGPPAGIAGAVQLGGKAMSYNNVVDADAAWRAAHDFDAPCVAIVKHANPCGIAVGEDLAAAHRKALACDPVSAYGGVVAANRPIDAVAAAQIIEVFTEVVAAPRYTDEALAVLASRRSLRVLRVDDGPDGPHPVESRWVSGGVLVQIADRIDADGDDPAGWTLVSGAPATADVMADLAFAWRAVRAVKSNGILLARDGASVGIGMGQVNRVDSCRLAVQRAGDLRAKGAVAASDAFFPFADGLQILIEAGVSAVVQPGGSVRDEEVVAVARDAGVTMYLTGARHFAH